MLLMLLGGRGTPPEKARFECTPARSVVGAVLAIGCAGASLPALAQTAAPAAASAPGSTEIAPSERAKRDADKVFHWILIQGDRTRKAPAPAPAATPKDERTASPKPPKTAARAGADAPPTVVLKADGAVAAPVSTAPEVRTRADASSAAETATTAPAPRSAALVEGAAGVANVARPDESKLTRVEPTPRAAAPAIDPPAAAAPVLVPIAQPEPQFPANLMRSLRSGTVQVRFSVLPDGSVTELEVLRTSNPRLNAAALAAVGQWRFQPISRAQSGAVELGFNLE